MCIRDSLQALSTTTPASEAAAVVDNDGLMIASALPGDVEDDRVAAMSAAPVSYTHLTLPTGDLV